MIDMKHLASVMVGLQTLANPPKTVDGFGEMYLRILNERSVVPPPTNAEFVEAATRILASEEFFPKPVRLIEMIREVRKERLTQARGEVRRRGISIVERGRVEAEVAKLSGVTVRDLSEDWAREAVEDALGRSLSVAGWMVRPTNSHERGAYIVIGPSDELVAEQLESTDVRQRLL